MSGMSRPAVLDFSEPVRTAGVWSVAFRAWYRLLRLIHTPLLWLVRSRGFGNVVVLRVTGRHTGRDRSLPLGMLTVGESRYLGHPSGDTAWTLNLRATKEATIESATFPAWRFRPQVLEPGPERDAVVRATFRQHPFPGNAIYRLAGRHVSATGVFFRLEGSQEARDRDPACE
jgi:hypothetical protein